MKNRSSYLPPRTSTLAGLALAVAAAVASSAALAQETFHLQWQSSGIHEKVSGFRPHGTVLKAEVPEGLKRAPEGVKAPLYGVIELGPYKAPTKFLIAAEVSTGKVARVFLDSNANRDFTDDAPCVTTNRSYTLRDGGEGKSWQAEGSVMIPFADGPRSGKLKFYGGQTRQSSGGGSQTILYYYTDYGLVGDVKIGGRTIPAALDDAGAVGHFRLDQDASRNPILWLGTTNSATGRVGVTTPAQRSFEVDGKWWALTNLTADGSFQVVASAKSVAAETKSAVDLSPGKKAPSFTAKLTSGKTVKFPEDYKGKVVLLDFWATWCGPCVAEIPNVVKAYEKFHPQGLEILGVSLDKENAEQKLADFTKKREMPWSQVYDGKFWQAEVAQLYGIYSIPHMLLVDGDTGVILANKAIRGEALAPAIEKALAGRKK